MSRASRSARTPSAGDAPPAWLVAALALAIIIVGLELLVLVVLLRA